MPGEDLCMGGRSPIGSIDPMLSTLSHVSEAALSGLRVADGVATFT